MRTRTQPLLPLRLQVLPLCEVRCGWLALKSLAAVLIGAFACASPAAAQSRGELLYSTHCVTCHTTQMHWRNNKAARDWAGLQFQVRRWQAAASLGWSEADVLEVSRYLNESIYRFDVPAAPSSSSSPSAGLAIGAGLLR